MDFCRIWHYSCSRTVGIAVIAFLSRRQVNLVNGNWTLTRVEKNMAEYFWEAHGPNPNVVNENRAMIWQRCTHNSQIESLLGTLKTSIPPKIINWWTISEMDPFRILLTSNMVCKIYVNIILTGDPLLWKYVVQWHHTSCNQMLQPLKLPPLFLSLWKILWLKTSP